MARRGYVQLVFQSTLPLRGATFRHADSERRRYISIHTPLAGSDPKKSAALHISSKFQSTLPLRGATDFVLGRAPLEVFQSTLPLRGATRSTRFPIRRTVYFNPHSPCGERPQK